MATRKQTVLGMSEAGEVNPVTTEASLQNMGADLIPRVSRGQRSPHYSARPIAAALTSLASPSPIKADHAVRTFWGLRKTDANSFDVGETFEEWLVRLVTEASIPEVQERMEKDAASEKRLQAWFCLSPPSISVHPTRKGGYLDHGPMFLPEVRTQDNVRRRGVETVIKLDLTLLLKVAGELLADTLARDPVASLLPPEASPAKGATGNETTPKKTKAAGPASPNGLQSATPEANAYPALAQTKPLNTAKSSQKQGSKQSASESHGIESQVRQPINSDRLTAYQPSTERTCQYGSFGINAAPP